MADPLIGVLLGMRYRIIERLGAEAGSVWLAKDEELDFLVAVKRLRLPDFASQKEHADLLALAKLEARHAGQLSHPSIVTVYDVVDEPDAIWVIMQRVVGRSLADDVA